MLAATSSALRASVSAEERERADIDLGVVMEGGRTEGAEERKTVGDEARVEEGEVPAGERSAAGEAVVAV